MKKIVSLILLISILLTFTLPSIAENSRKSVAETISNSGLDLSGDAFSVYLCEAKTGKVLYSDNEFEKASPA